MIENYNENQSSSDSRINDIISDASLLGDGTYREIYNNIEKLEPLQENVISLLNTKNQDWALNTVLDIFPNIHAAAVAFLKSSMKGQEIYNNIFSFVKRCFLNMQCNTNNLKLYRALLSFYYNEKTTITMLPAKKQAFYFMEFEDCEKDYKKIDSLINDVDKLRIAYHLLLARLL